ncbi:MAG: gamma-glutamyltranspeptidase/glutathione hydrolase [Gammaproteobacteria bacterium]|jgi:gamma-glutamyltranspeptidase/glutathione hydrolase
MNNKTNAMIVAAQPEAAEAGAKVLMRGGNAVDAAMAAALVQGVVDPQMCGIAGFGNCQIYMPGRGVHTCIDFHGKTPLAATPDMWLHLLEGETRDGFGFIVKDEINDLGYQSITAPGSLLAYFEAVRDFGSFDWPDVVQAAIDHADRGFVVRPHVNFWWQYGGAMGRADVRERLALSQTGRDIYFHADGSLKRIGDRVQNPDMARTLRRIAKDGAEVFYHGEIAERIDADMRANGGLLSLKDLHQYQTKRGDPLHSSYRGNDIHTNQPPGGGIMLLQMLNILEAFDLTSLGHNSSEYIRTVCEAMKAATSDKDHFVGDPDFVDVPIERLIGKDHARQIATRIKAGERMHVERLDAPAEPADTTHVAVVDAQGNCVTMTHSLGMPSGVITDGLGFMYNGCMGVFDPRPGRAGSIAAGKSRFSSVCPTIVMRDGTPRVVIGAPGGTQIAMGVLQALLNVIDFDMPMDRAVAAPRFSSTSDVIDICNRIPDYTLEPLRKSGYEVERSALGFHFAAVHGIRIDDGELSGGADPGHDGVALAV